MGGGEEGGKGRTEREREGEQHRWPYLGVWVMPGKGTEVRGGRWVGLVMVCCYCRPGLPLPC